MVCSVYSNSCCKIVNPNSNDERWQTCDKMRNCMGSKIRCTDELENDRVKGIFVLNIVFYIYRCIVPIVSV